MFETLVLHQSDQGAALIGTLCARDEAIKAAYASPDMLIATMRPLTSAVALRLLQEHNVTVTEAVLAALTECSMVTRTRALSFDGGQWLWDDGTDVPLGNDPYTWECWLRVTGEGCFFGYGKGERGQANGLHFQPDMTINHCKYRASPLSRGSLHKASLTRCCLSCRMCLISRWRTVWWDEDLEVGGKLKKDQWCHLVLRCDGARRSMVLDGIEIGADTPDGHDVQLDSSFYIGARFNFAGKGGDDPFRGAFSEVRLWKRCLADAELALPINASAPPEDLVRWLCLTDEDAGDADGKVTNRAAHGPPVMTVGSADKPKWIACGPGEESGEADTEHTSAAQGPATRLLMLAVDLPSAPLLDHLVANSPPLKVALAAPEVLLGVLVPRLARAALRLFEAYDLAVSEVVCEALLDNPSGKGSRFQALLRDASAECAALVHALVARSPALKAAAAVG